MCGDFRLSCAKMCFAFSCCARPSNRFISAVVSRSREKSKSFSAPMTERGTSSQTASQWATSDASLSSRYPITCSRKNPPGRTRCCFSICQEERSVAFFVSVCAASITHRFASRAASRAVAAVKLSHPIGPRSNVAISTGRASRVGNEGCCFAHCQHGPQHHQPQHHSQPNKTFSRSLFFIF